MNKNKVQCTYHRSPCGRHFHSLAAFDVHRTGDYAAPVGSKRGRRCLSPIEVLDRNGNERFLALTEDGACRVYEHGTQRRTNRCDGLDAQEGSGGRANTSAVLERSPEAERGISRAEGKRIKRLPT